jgi:hypothetical protein
VIPGVYARHGGRPRGRAGRRRASSFRCELREELARLVGERMRGFVENRHSLSRAFHRARSVAGEVVGLSETEQRVAFADAVTDLPAERELLSEVFDGARVVAQVDGHQTEVAQCVGFALPVPR